MSWLLERVDLLITTNLKYLAARALEAHSLSLVDEYIRRGEDTLSVVADTAATVGAQAQIVRTKQAEYTAKLEALDQSVDLLLTQNDLASARAAQSRYNTAAGLATAYEEQAAAQETAFQALLQARLKLEAKLTEVRQERGELADLLASTADDGSSGETATNDSMDASGMAEKEIRRRISRSEDSTQPDTARLANQISRVLEENTLDEQLAERKLRLGLE